jgi:peptide/nickel transport system substrate-binding protein
MAKQEDYGGLTRREFLSLSAIGAAGFALGGFPDAGYGQDKKPKRGGIFRAGSTYASKGLDVHKNQEFSDYLNYGLMYGALTEQGPVPNVESHPFLAKSWEISNDGREYIFSLREGVKFHHGKELDSGDVKYSLDRVMNPATRSPRAFAFRWVESVKVIDKYHIKIRLKEPFAPFLASLTIYNCAIIPAGWEPTGMKPAPGTGPFVLKSFQPNETLELKRFEHYWEFDEATGDRLPYLEGYRGVKIVDPNVRWTALRSGELETSYTPPLNVLAKAILEKPLPGIFVDFESVGNGWIWLNTSKPPFNDKRVRQALAYVLDKKNLMKSVFWGLGETVNEQPFSNRSRFYIPVKERERNVAKAKQLLAEAGYRNGFKTELLEFGQDFYTAGAETFMGQMKEIGIGSTMNVIDRAPYWVTMRKGDYTISYGGMDERFDWDDAYYMYFHSSEIGNNNYCRYSNKELDGLLEKGRTTWKWEERVPIYKKVVEILAEDVPVIYIYKTTVGYALRDYVKGFRKGFATRPSWHGGGTKYWWIDK